MRENRKNRQLRAVMDSGTLALLYFDVILLDGSRAVAVTSEAGGWRPEAGDQRLEARDQMPEDGG